MFSFFARRSRKPQPIRNRDPFRTRRVRPGVEQLESRLAPAVTVGPPVGGVLTITGNATGQNSITITENAPNDFTIEGTGGTEVNGAANGTFNATGVSVRITINFTATGAGGSDVTYVGLGMADPTDPPTTRDLTYSGGTGIDTFTAAGGLNVRNLSITSPAGDVANDVVNITQDLSAPATRNIIYGTLSIAHQAGDNTVTIESLVRGATTITGLGGIDTTTIQNQSAFLGAVTINGGAGNNGVTIQGGTTLGGTLTITHTGTGNATNTLDDVVVQKATKITNGVGAAGHTNTLTNATFNNALTITAGAGSKNTTDIDGSTVFLNTTITNRDLDDLVTIDGSAFGGALTITNGKGADTVAINDTTVQGGRVGTATVGLKIAGTDGNDDIDITGLELGSLLSIALGNGAASTIDIATTNVTSAATITTGTGGATASITQSEFQTNLTYTGGTGADDLTLEGLRVFGNLAATLGNGTNVLGADGLTIGGTTKFTGGVNDDTFDLVNLVLGKTLTITGNTGVNDMAVTTASVAGNVVVANTTSATSSGKFVATDADFNGSFAFTGTVNADELTFVNVNVNTTLTVTGSNGDNVVDFASTFVGSTARFTLGTGNDQVFLDDASFMKAVTITGSSGDNEVLLGNTATVVVGGNLAITGTTGSDTVTLLDVLVAGTTTINTNGANAAAVDTITIEFSRFGGAFSLITGAGNDIVLISTDVSDPFAPDPTPPTQFLSTVSIVTNNGADTIELGADDFSVGAYIVASGAVTINGGAGIDTLINDPSNIFVSTLTLISIDA